MVGTLFCLVLSSLAADAKLPIPDDNAQTQAVNAVREIYGDEWRAASTLQQKAVLARKLMADSDNTKDDAAGRFVLLRTVRDMAAQIGDVELTRDACQRLEAAYEVGDMRSETLRPLAKSVRAKEGYALLTEFALETLAREIEAERFESAVACLTVAEDVVRRAGNTTLSRRVADAHMQLDVHSEAWNKAQKALKVVREKPTDEAANETLGRYYCFVRGDWGRGLPYLALAADKDLVMLASADLKKPEDADAQIALADQWWEFDEPSARDRAAYWYRKALPRVTGLAKARIEKRLHETSAQVSDESVMKYFVAGQQWVGINTHTKGPEAGNGVLLVTLSIAEMRGNAFSGRFDWRGLGPNGLSQRTNGENIVGTRDGDNMTWRGESTAQGSIYEGSALLVNWRNGEYSGEALLLPQKVVDISGYVGRWNALSGDMKDSNFLITHDAVVTRSTMPNAKAMIIGSKELAIIGWSSGDRALVNQVGRELQMRVYDPATGLSAVPRATLTLRK